MTLSLMQLLQRLKKCKASKNSRKKASKSSKGEKKSQRGGNKTKWDKPVSIKKPGLVSKKAKVEKMLSKQENSSL